MMKNLKPLLLLALLPLSIELYAQKAIKDKFFLTCGITPFSEYFRTRVILQEVTGWADYYTGQPPQYVGGLNEFRGEFTGQLWGYGFFGFNFEPRFNLIESGKHHSFSVASAMSASISYISPYNRAKRLGQNNSYYGTVYYSKNKDVYIRNITGVGHMTMHLLCSYNYGMGSTYHTDKELGFSVGVGPLFLFTPFLVGNSEPSSYDYINSTFSEASQQLKYRSLHVMPLVFNTRVRFWTSKNKARELSLSFRPGSKKPFYPIQADRQDDPLANRYTVYQNFYFKLSMNWILNY